MRNKLQIPFVLLIIFSMILGACTPPATTAVPTAIPATEAPAIEPTTPPEPTLIPPPDVAPLFEKLIASLPADQGFGSVGAAKLNEELASEPPFLLDVRETSEVETDGYIEGAVHIPVRELLKNLDKLPALDDPIVVYCASGHRGGMVVASLKLLGYSNVRNLGGGLGAWKKASLPVESGQPAAPETISSPVVANEALFTMLDEFLSGLPEGFYSIKADKLAVALAANEPPVLIDVRTVEEWNKDGYIEGAIKIPFNEFFTTLDKLPAKDAPIVMYCGSGYRGSIIMMGLRLMGYTDVTNLGGGLGDWKTAKLPVTGWVDWTTVWTDFLASMPANNHYVISVDALNTMLAEEPPFLLDIRESSEIEKDGYIAGAVNIPVRDLLKNLDKLPALDDPIVVYCASGHRGGMAVASLRLLGYTNVVDLGGGLGAWKKASLPVETGQPAAPVAATMPKVDETRLRDLDAFLANLPDGFYSVKAADLNLELGNTPAPALVDVRTADEVAKAAIEGSLAIPIEELLTSLDQLPDKSSPVVVLCQSGHRGSIGMMALRMLGYTNVRNLGGGLNAWVAAELPTTAG